MIAPTEADIGRAVIYSTPHDAPERGVISSLSSTPGHVFVRYRSACGELTPCNRLEWEDCPGHVASDADAKVCRHCGTHVDEERPGEEFVP